jgi:hypothetical protein
MRILMLVRGVSGGGEQGLGIEGMRLDTIVETAD